MIFFVQSEVTLQKKRTESTKKLIWSFKDKLWSDFNSDIEKTKILSKDNQGKLANEIKKLSLCLLCDITLN